MTVKFRIKCTTCQKTEDMTEAQQKEAQEIGCAFSSCCHAVATVERIEYKPDRLGKARQATLQSLRRP